jgi:uncharacterized membrane protein YeaQ/YmgE (transglycosylase-associated protein family)
MESGLVIVAWILVGLLAGSVAGQVASCAKLGVIGRIALALSGAVATGALVNFWAGGVDVTHAQFWCMFSSMTGVVIVLVTHDERFTRFARSQQR